MSHPFSRHRLLCTAVAAVLVATMGSAAAQSASDRSRAGRNQAEQPLAGAEQFPDATREAPDMKTSGKTARRLQQMVDLQQEGSGAEAAAIADAILADEGTSAYEKAVAAQTAAQIAYEAGDVDRAVALFEQVVELDALDNNNHYTTMLNLAQLQQQQKRYTESLATYDRFFAETGSNDPQAMMMKGQALLLLERFPEAAELMEQAIQSSGETRPEWQALLMQAHARGGNAGEAVRLAEEVAAAKPDDRRAQLNLAVTYQQAGMQDRAVEVLEKMRGAGQLTEANEYQQLYANYINMEGKEREAIEVIEDGLAKGVLSEDFNTTVALAQANYFSGQIEPAIAAYRKAAPLDDDGSTYLNLAKVLLNEGRDEEAKAAATQALAKGIGNPGEAQSIIDR
jgi:tetratricopeptide (TPR) repeat protein